MYIYRYKYSLPFCTLSEIIILTNVTLVPGVGNILIHSQHSACSITYVNLIFAMICYQQTGNDFVMYMRTCH